MRGGTEYGSPVEHSMNTSLEHPARRHTRRSVSTSSSSTSISSELDEDDELSLETPPPTSRRMPNCGSF